MRYNCRMLAIEQTFKTQRHLDLPPNVWQASGPPGPDIQLLDNGFIVWAGLDALSPDELARMHESLGEQYGVSPVGLEIESQALQNWGEQLIQDAMRDLTSRLVQRLGLYDEAEGFLAGSRIANKIRLGFSSILPVLDEDGQQVTLLEVFGNDERACTAALFAGLYFS